MVAVFETGGETYDGAFKSLHLSESCGKLEMAEIKVSKEVPLSVDEMPPKVLEVIKTRKYIIFIKKIHVPKGSDLSGTYINSTPTHLLLMSSSFKEAQSLAVKTPWLDHHGGELAYMFK